MVNEFVYSQPVKIYFGAGKFASLPEILAELGCRKSIIVCGRHFAPEAHALVEKNIGVCAVFSGVEQNPQLSGVEEALKLAREFDTDSIIGIGGGSSIDTAKFAAATAPGEVDMDKLVHDCAVHPLMNNNPVRLDEAALREMFEGLK